MNQADMEDSLRAMLADRARRAPHSDALADQIITEAVSGSAVRQLHRPAVRRRSWGLPLLAVAAVAAVVAGGIGISSLSATSNGHAQKPVALPSPTLTPTTPPASATTSEPSTAVVQTPTTLPVLPTDGTYLHINSTLDNGARLVSLDAFKAVDLTFVGSNIWAMGTATCIATGTGRCTALVHSTDGVHWTLLSTSPFNLPDDTAGCATVCVDHIRFATPEVGYVFGPSTLLMTTDAGRTWTAQSGGALALETLDGNVIRVSGSVGCPPGCTYTVQTSGIGSTDWTTVSLPGNYLGDGVTLARTSHFAYLLSTGNPAGGAQDEQSALFTSADDGATWTNRGEVCQQNPGANGEVDSTAMTGGSDGSIAVICQPRLASATTKAWVTVSTDSGASFHRKGGTVPGDHPTLLGAGTAEDFCVQDSVLYCTHNGGASYAKAHDSNGKTVKAVWLGFEDQSDGRALQIDGTGADVSSDLWTTHDGGTTWGLTVGIG